MMPKPTILIKNDRDELAHAGAELFVDIARRSIRHSGRFAVALSGGSTPGALYQALASESFRDSVDWKSVYFFFGDERNVPLDSPDSNYRMAKETLLDHLPLGADSVKPWTIAIGSPEETAARYESELKSFFGGSPVFDLILLGLGQDGHTASLFAETAALAETERIAIANWIPKLNDHRFTMTLPVINSATNVVFVVTGREKAEVVRNVIQGEGTLDHLPARMVQPLSGCLFWLVDNEAADRLDQTG